MNYLLIYNDLGETNYKYKKSDNKEYLLDLMYDIKKTNQTIQFNIFENKI